MAPTKKQQQARGSRVQRAKGGDRVAIVTRRDTGGRGGVHKPAGKDKRPHLQQISAKHFRKAATIGRKRAAQASQQAGGQQAGGKPKRWNPKINHMGRVMKANDNKLEEEQNVKLMEFAQQWYWRFGDLRKRDKDVRKRENRQDRRDDESRRRDDASRRRDKDSRRRERDTKEAAREVKRTMDEFHGHRRLVQTEQEKSGELGERDLRHNLELKETLKMQRTSLNDQRVLLQTGEKSLRKARRELEKEKETVVSLGERFRASGASC